MSRHASDGKGIIAFLNKCFDKTWQKIKEEKIGYSFLAAEVGCAGIIALCGGFDYAFGSREKQNMHTETPRYSDNCINPIVYNLPDERRR